MYWRFPAQLPFYEQFPIAWRALLQLHHVTDEHASPIFFFIKKKRKINRIKKIDNLKQLRIIQQILIPTSVTRLWFMLDAASP